MTEIPDITLLWNLLLSVVAASIVWGVRGINTRIQENSRMISMTREDMVRHSVLRHEVEKDFSTIMVRIDRIENKVDNIISNMLIEQEKKNQR